MDSRSLLAQDGDPRPQVDDGGDELLEDVDAAGGAGGVLEQDGDQVGGAHAGQ